MLTEIIDAIIIVDNAVLVRLIDLSQTIFHHKEGNLVTVIQFVQRIAQSQRVDLPAPGGRFQVRVRRSLISAGVTGKRCAVLMRCGAVIAEAKVVGGVFPHQFLVTRLHFHMDIFLIPDVSHVVGVVAADHNVAVQQRATAQFHSLKHIFRAAAVWIDVAQ